MTASVTDLLLDLIRTHLGDEEIGPDDDFYAMGGDSLTALRVVTEAQGRGLSVSLRDLLYYPTARDLAAHLEQANTEQAGAGQSLGAAASGAAGPARAGLLDPVDRALVPDAVTEAVPASALQVGMIYLCEASGDPELYHSRTGWRTRAAFDEKLFREALTTVSRRHPALRTSFDLGTFSVPVQLVWAEVEPRLTVEPADQDGPHTAAELARRWSAEQVKRPFDWSGAPLLRCHVVTERDSFQVALSCDHAIADGWGLGRMIVDLLTVYDALLRGVAPDLPELPATAHQDFAAAEAAALASPEAAEFWRAEADVPVLLIDPGVRTAAANAVGQHAFGLEPELLEALRSAARRSGASLKAFVLGVHAWTLGAWLGRDQDIVTGVVVSTRPETADSDLVVGLYLNTLPMRFVRTARSWAELAGDAMTAERRSMPHRAFPLAQIETRLGRPAFDVTFNYTDFHLYEGLGNLTALRADGWWVEGKPSFPFRVDFEVEGLEGGSRVVVDFDPDLVDPNQAEHYAELYRQALAAAAEDPSAPAQLPSVSRAVRA
ncbi:condensation domain-containing protein [Streptomyces sp. NPDC048581]|uniref:condensation domain-containing protein n=1 Tax=Streptomyces sp. NPDC048581 TaxID=3365572 RepID=UPI00371D1019